MHVSRFRTQLTQLKHLPVTHTSSGTEQTFAIWGVLEVDMQDYVLTTPLNEPLQNGQPNFDLWECTETDEDSLVLDDVEDEETYHRVEEKFYRILFTQFAHIFDEVEVRFSPGLSLPGKIVDDFVLMGKKTIWVVTSTATQCTWVTVLRSNGEYAALTEGVLYDAAMKECDRRAKIRSLPEANHAASRTHD